MPGGASPARGGGGRVHLVDGQLHPVCLAQGMLSADGTVSAAAGIVLTASPALGYGGHLHGLSLWNLFLLLDRARFTLPIKALPVYQVSLGVSCESATANRSLLGQS